MGYNISRRTALLGIGAVITGASSIGTQVIAQEESPLAFVEIAEFEEYVVIRNDGDEDYDLTDHSINFEVGQEVDQIRDFPDGLTVESGDNLTIAAGAENVSDADVNMDYDGHVINNDGSDVIGILDPDGEILLRSDNDDHWITDGDGDDENGGSDDDETGVNGDDENGSSDDDEDGVNGDDDEDDSDEDDGDDAGDDQDRQFPEKFRADLTGEGHGIETDAVGEAHFRVVDETEATYELTVRDICNVTMAHIHLGGANEDGPIVVWLYPEESQEAQLQEGRFSGELAEGSITEDDLVGEWDGAQLEDAVATMAEEGAYVNVHTEDHPGGEIRGQITPVDD